MQIGSSTLNRVGEWNDLNLNYRINIFSKNSSSFERRGGSCELCDNAHSFPASCLCQNIPSSFHFGVLYFKVAECGGDSLFWLILKILGTFRHFASVLRKWNVVTAFMWALKMFKCCSVSLQWEFSHSDKVTGIRCIIKSSNLLT